MTANEIMPEGTPAVDPFTVLDGLKVTNSNGESVSPHIVAMVNEQVDPFAFPPGLTVDQKLDVLLRIVNMTAGQVNWIGTEFQKLLAMAEAMGSGGMGSAIFKRAMGMGGGK